MKLAIALTFAFGIGLAENPTPPQTTTARCAGYIQAVDHDKGASIDIFLADGCKLKPGDPRRPRLCVRTLKVTGATLQKTVKDLRPGDGVQFAYSTTGTAQAELTELIYYYSADEQPPAGARIGAMVAGAVTLLLATWLWAGRQQNPLRALLVGVDNRYSNSQTQTVLWFGALITGYLSLLVLRYIYTGYFGYIGIPQNLLLLSGLSGLTFVGAKAVREKKEIAAGATPGAPADRAATPSLLNDLSHNNRGEFDLGDFQMLVITVVAVVSYLVLMYGALGNLDYRVAAQLPDVDSTILAGFGLGQGTYLAKKATTDRAS